MRARLPWGFRCPRCQCDAHFVVGRGARRLFQRIACKYQMSLAADSLMEHIKLPLATWFLAIYLVSHAKTGLLVLALKHQPGGEHPHGVAAACE